MILHRLIAADDGNRTEWERQREREEFARTARVFQPMGSSLTSRFTRSQKEAQVEGSPEVDVCNIQQAFLQFSFPNNS